MLKRKNYEESEESNLIQKKLKTTDDNDSTVINVADQTPTVPNQENNNNNQIDNILIEEIEEKSPLSTLKELLESNIINKDKIQELMRQLNRGVLEALLFEYIAASNMKIVELMLLMDLQLYVARNKDRMTPVHLAAMTGNLELLKTMFSSLDPKFHLQLLICPWHQDRQQNANCANIIPLHLAVQNNHLEVVKYLVELDTQLVSPWLLDMRYLNRKRLPKNQSISWASRLPPQELNKLYYSSREMRDRLLSSTEPDIEGYPLDYAIKQGNVEIFKYLISKTYFVESQLKHRFLNNRLLYIAAAYGQKKLFKALIDQGATGAYHEEGTYYGALYHFITNEVKQSLRPKENSQAELWDADMAKFFVRAGDRYPDISHEKEEDNKTSLLLLAISYERLGIAKYLIERALLTLTNPEQSKYLSEALLSVLNLDRYTKRSIFINAIQLIANIENGLVFQWRDEHNNNILHDALDQLHRKFKYFNFDDRDRFIAELRISANLPEMQLIELANRYSPNIMNALNNKQISPLQVIKDPSRSGYDIDLVPQDGILRKNMIYVSGGNPLKYQCLMKSSGQFLTGEITAEELKYIIKMPLDINQMKQLLPRILAITSKNNHTPGDSRHLSSYASFFPCYSTDYNNNSNQWKDDFCHAISEPQSVPNNRI